MATAISEVSDFRFKSAPYSERAVAPIITSYLKIRSNSGNIYQKAESVDFTGSYGAHFLFVGACTNPRSGMRNPHK